MDPLSVIVTAHNCAPLIGRALDSVAHSLAYYHQAGSAGRDTQTEVIEGRLKGRKGDGLDVGGALKGSAFVSAETGQVLSADTTVTADMDLTFRRKRAKLIATLAVSIRRPAPPPK